MTEFHDRGGFYIVGVPEGIFVSSAWAATLYAEASSCAGLSADEAAVEVRKAVIQCQDEFPWGAIKRIAERWIVIPNEHSASPYRVVWLGWALAPPWELADGRTESVTDGDRQRIQVRVSQALAAINREAIWR